MKLTVWKSNYNLNQTGGAKVGLAACLIHKWKTYEENNIMGLVAFVCDSCAGAIFRNDVWRYKPYKSAFLQRSACNTLSGTVFDVLFHPALQQ